MDEKLKNLAQRWLAEDPDPETRAELEALIASDDEAELRDRFGAQLEFGTAGLRGVLGAGPNRMNRATVIRTTAGLCTYLRAQGLAERGVVIGYDGRRMSRELAEDAARVCAGAGVRAHLFEEVAPTPLVAFAVRDLAAGAGAMVTASHNPPEYNGYKVYWVNAAQIVPPHDKGIAAAIARVAPIPEIPRPELEVARARDLVVTVPPAVSARYLDAVAAESRHPEAPRKADLSIVYTPLHGVGNRLVRQALERAGFTRVETVPEQAAPDGAFPTVAFPNPEEKGAMDLSLALADRRRADLVLANDPDADRLAVATRDEAGGWVQLTGNEVGALFAHYLLVEDPRPARDRLAITTIVSSPLLGAMCGKLGVRYDEVLTGFKWIANRAMQLEAETGTRFVFGYEEALGYTVGTVCRDKDGVGAAAIFAELAAHYRVAHGRSLLAQLDEIYRTFGLYTSGQHNVTKKGLDGAAQIEALMDFFREAPPGSIGGLPVERVTDLKTGERLEPRTGKRERVHLPSSNVIAYALGDGSRITVRPSGTEPKIKYYFDVREEVAAGEPMAAAKARAADKMRRLMDAFVAIAG